MWAPNQESNLKSKLSDFPGLSAYLFTHIPLPFPKERSNILSHFYVFIFMYVYYYV